MKSIKTGITSDSQRFYDEPINVLPIRISALEMSIANIFKRALPKPICTGHNRVQLRWMTPDGHGGLVPKEK